jgi:signal transduction histidine kinase
VMASAEPDAGATTAAAFASAIHELKNPILVILGFADLIEQHWSVNNGDSGGTDEAREMLGIVRRAGERLTRLVEDLLVVARLDADMPSLRLADADLRSIVTAASHIATARGQPITVVCAESLTLRTDPDRLEQIVGTLVENACRHGAPPIEVIASRLDGVVSIAVRDGGPGVTPEDVDALFDQFSRLAAGKQGSNGLGLHTARRVARWMQGELRYEVDDDRGRGFFLITLPD